MTPDARAQLDDQGPAGGSGPRGRLPYRSAQGRWVLAAMILGSSVTGMDSTVVVVALPAIGRNLHAGFQGLRWTVTADTLTLASLILLAGSLSDRWGRRRVFLAGLGWFTLASVLCAARSPGAPGRGGAVQVCHVGDGERGCLAGVAFQAQRDLPGAQIRVLLVVSRG